MARELDLRCACSARPLLGVCGRRQDGEPYIHIKVYKQSRIFGEIVAVGGDVHIKCRECLRWHTVTIKRGGVDFAVEPLPSDIQI